jgi:hypothetical protein
VNGVPQAFESDGKTPCAGRDGVTPLSLAEWLDTQVSDAPHLFASSAGGGGGGATSPYGSGSGGAGHGDNPWKSESFNLTKQGQIMKTNPALAASLKSAAQARG